MEWLFNPQIWFYGAVAVVAFLVYKVVRKILALITSVLFLIILLLRIGVLF